MQDKIKLMTNSYYKNVNIFTSHENKTRQASNIHDHPNVRIKK